MKYAQLMAEAKAEMQTRFPEPPKTPPSKPKGRPLSATSYMAQVLAHLNASEQHWTTSQVVDALGLRKMAVQSALQELVGRRMIQRVGWGVYARVAR